MQFAFADQVPSLRREGTIDQHIIRLPEEILQRNTFHAPLRRCRLRYVRVERQESSDIKIAEQANCFACNVAQSDRPNSPVSGLASEFCRALDPSAFAHHAILDY